MKKLNKYLFLLAAVVFGLSACEKQQDREPSPVFAGQQAVFFPKSTESAEVEPGGVFEHVISIARDTNNTEEITVKLVVTQNTEDVFEVPETVTFPANEKETTFTVKFPNAQVDSTYTLSVELADSVSNPYLTLKPQYSFTVNIAKWDPVTDKKAVIYDGLVVSIPFGLDVQKWYVSYVRKDNSDGSFDIRLLNPYASMPTGDADKFGAYDGFPYNEDGDFDTEGTYNMTIHVAKNGTATFDRFEMGMNWSYGMFSARYYDPTIPGIWNAEDKSITFPAGSSAVFMADWGGTLTSKDIVVYIDDALWKDINSAVTIAGLEDGLNDASLTWTEIPGNLSTLVSTIQPGLIDVTLENVVDPNPEDKQGPESDFYNLFRLADVYAAGYGLAFYWDTIKGEIKIPSILQPTGLNFAGKDIFVGRASTDSYVEKVKLQGKDASIFHLFYQLQTKDGGNLGEYEEMFYFSTEEIIWGEKAEDFVGTYKLTGSTQFSNGTDADLDVAIEIKDDKLYLLGVTYADTIWLDFDDVTKKISIAPQQLGNYGPYDIALVTTTVDGNVSQTEPIVFSMNFGGTIKTDASSNADGYLLNSESAGGYVSGYYDLVFKPAAPAAAPAKAPAVSVKTARAKHVTHSVTPKQNNWKIQGKVSKHRLRLK